MHIYVFVLLSYKFISELVLHAGCKTIISFQILICSGLLFGVAFTLFFFLLGLNIFKYLAMSWGGGSLWVFIVQCRTLETYRKDNWPAAEGERRRKASWRGADLSGRN